MFVVVVAVEVINICSVSSTDAKCDTKPFIAFGIYEKYRHFSQIAHNSQQLTSFFLVPREVLSGKILSGPRLHCYQLRGLNALIR